MFDDLVVRPPSPHFPQSRIAVMEKSEPTSPVAPHAPNHDSMVTVSLSDIQSSSEHTQPDWRNLDIPPTPVNASHEGDSFGPMPLQDAARTSPVPVSEPTTPTATRDNKDAEEETDNEVDWENLEKTEEKEPRGEGSDEVSDEKRSIQVHRRRGFD